MLRKIKNKVKSIVSDEADAGSAKIDKPASPASPQIQFSLSNRYSAELLPVSDCSRDDCSGAQIHTHSSHPPRAPKCYSQPLSGKSFSNELGCISLLGQEFSEVREKYILCGELGRGLQGVTRMCSDRETGLRYACKSIAKHMIRRKEHAEAIRTEVKALELLSEEPSVIGIKGVYEDQLKIHLVMELCEGGDLFSRIKEKKRFSERESALVIKQIACAMKACHAAGVVHRDLKPENILMCSRESDTDIKLADFGVAAFIKPGETLSTVAGSPYYVAPEVLKANYGVEADVWSAGVVLHIMLSGRPPFWHRDIDSIFRAIREAEVTMSSPVWKTISSSAKELVHAMLTRDRTKRITPSEILEHPWIKEYAKEMPAERPVLSASSSVNDSTSSQPIDHGSSSRKGSLLGSYRHLAVPSLSAADLESMSFGVCTTSSSEFNWISFDQVADPNKEEMLGMLDKEFRELVEESKAHLSSENSKDEIAKTDIINPDFSDKNFEVHLDLDSRRVGVRLVKLPESASS